jgi:hypothetical protein
VAGGLTAVLACGESESLDELPCPCAPGYVCCEATNVCQSPGTACVGESPRDAGARQDARAKDAAADADEVFTCPAGAVPVVARTSLDPRTWNLTGSNPSGHVMELDPSWTILGRPGLHIASRSPDAPVEKFGTMSSVLDATPYLGRRVRFSAIVKSKDVTGSGRLWLRVDGPSGGLALDNMERRPLIGSVAPNRYETVIDVPPEAVRLAFGLLLLGAGEVWGSDPVIERVEADARHVQDPATWIAAGALSDYVTATGAGEVCGQPTARIASLVSAPAGAATLHQEISAEPYRGKRVRLSGLVERGAAARAGLFMRVEDVVDRSLVASAAGRRAGASAGWGSEEIVLDVPLEAVSISHGLRLEGAGEVQMGPLRLDVVTREVPTTDDPR